MFFKAGESVIATQRAFQGHFLLYCYDAILNRKSILFLFENFRATDSSIKRNPPESRLKIHQFKM